MALDYVLTRPEVRFFATDAERLAHFDALGIDRSCLPQRRYQAFRSRSTTTRYCDDAYPLGVLVDAADGCVTELAYIDDGAASAAGFETYLCQYRRVLSALPRWRVVYVAHAPTHVAQAEAIFARVLATDGSRVAAPDPSADDPLLEYFKLRRAYEAQEWRALDKGALDRFRALRQRFTSAAITGRYLSWKARGETPRPDAATERRLATPAAGESSSPTCCARVMPRSKGRGGAHDGQQPYAGLSRWGERRSPQVSPAPSPLAASKPHRDSPMDDDETAGSTSGNTGAETGATPARGETACSQA